MKTWILKSDMSHSPSSVVRAYYRNAGRPKFGHDLAFTNRSKQHFLVRRLRSQLKSLSRHLTYETIAEINNV